MQHFFSAAAIALLSLCSLSLFYVQWVGLHYCPHAPSEP